MTVSASYAALSYSGNGATTAFAVSWPFFTGTLVVTLVDEDGIETAQTISTHYTVTGGTDSSGLPATGTVTMLTAPATGETLQIARATPKTQPSVWTDSNAFTAKSLESVLDRLTLVGQELDGAADEAVSEITFASGTVTTGAAGTSASASIAGEFPDYTINLTIPRGEASASGDGTGDVTGPASATANAIALFDGTTGKAIKNSGYTITAAGAALLDDAAASDQRTTLGLGALATLATVGTSQIDNDAVTYAKMQNISAQYRLLGRVSSGAGNTEELTLSQALDFGSSPANGDILIRSGGAWVRLGLGASGYVLTSNGTIPAWAASSGAVENVRLGTEANSGLASDSTTKAPTGNVLTGLADMSDSIRTLYYKPMQKQVSGSWTTVSG